MSSVRLAHTRAPAAGPAARDGDRRPRPAEREASRRRIVLLLGGVLAVEAADLATIGAVAPELERALGISHAQLGLLAAVGTLTAAAATIPVGVLADRRRRTPLLAASVALWAAATVVGGAAGSFLVLLLSRVALGALTATAGPTLLSLIGDYFPAGERARSYGLILGGEMVGSGFGFLVSGSVAGLASWRWAFWVLVPPAVALSVALWRALPEPPRGGRAGDRRPRGDDAPHDHRVLRDDPRRLSLLAALRYALSVRTNLLLILAGTTANFFFAGVRTFTLVFIRGHYGLSQTLATGAMGVLGLGALAGVLAGGRVSDHLRDRGRRTARVTVAGVATLVTALLWTVPLITTSVAIGLGVGIVAAAAMSFPNAPLDAARLDVMPARLRGRSESLRAVLRSLAFACAPLLFGWVADRFRTDQATGTRNAFLLMLIPLFASGLVLLWARRSYLRDVATADATDEGRDDR